MTASVLFADIATSLFRWIAVSNYCAARFEFLPDSHVAEYELEWVLKMTGNTWALMRGSVAAFIDDEAITRGAAIAFYTVTSIGPVLFIVVAIAGLVFGEDAARGAISAQLGSLMGQQSAELLQTAIQNAARTSTGFLAAAVGIGTLVITASGVFTEMQQTLNVIWRAEPHGTTISRLAALPSPPAMARPAR